MAEQNAWLSEIWTKISLTKCLTVSHCLATIDAFDRNEVSELEIRSFAEKVELSEDVLYEDSYRSEIADFLFALASPELDGRSVAAVIRHWRERFLI